MGTIPCVRVLTVHPQKGVGRDGRKRTQEGVLATGKTRVVNMTGGLAAIFFVARATVGPCHGGDGRGDTTGQGNGSDERDERFVEQHCDED